MISAYYNVIEGDAGQVAGRLEDLAKAEKGNPDFSPEMVALGMVTTEKLLKFVYAVKDTSVACFPQRIEHDTIGINGRTDYSISTAREYLERKLGIKLLETGRYEKQ